MKRRKDSGFTLIELMIVIAVIGILAVVLVPKMAGIKTSAKITGVQTNAKSVQAYVVANINGWINQSYDDGDVATRLYVNFTDAGNEMKNPISSKKSITSKVGGLKSFGGSAISATTVSTDAMQMLASVPDAGDEPKGGVVVVIPATANDIATSGITIIGYDDNGFKIDEYTAKP